MEPIYQEIGETIRKLRETKLRISQEELSKRTGMSRPSIANIEKGRQHITISQLIRFSSVLGISACDLLPDERSGKADSALADVLPSDADPSLRAWVNSLQG